MLNFIFCIHNHQPVGNFDHVLEDAYTRAYEPFLKKISKFPSIKLTLHTSGLLLDWLCENQPAYIDLLARMVDSKQVEILGGGFYEPVLAVIPKADRLGQIQMMSERVYELFGVRPRGLWLAERVWEPTLPKSLKEAGIVISDAYVIINRMEGADKALEAEGVKMHNLTNILEITNSLYEQNLVSDDILNKVKNQTS